MPTVGEHWRVPRHTSTGGTSFRRARVPNARRWHIDESYAEFRPFHARPFLSRNFQFFRGKKKFRKMRVLSIRFLSLLSFQPMQVDLSSNWLTLWSLLGLEIKGRNSIKIRYFSIERDFFLNIATLISFQFRNVDKSIKIWRFLIETDFFVCLKIGFPKIYLGKCEFPIEIVIKISWTSIERFSNWIRSLLFFAYVSFIDSNSKIGILYHWSQKWNDARNFEQ